jgi:hypothetical protein
MSLHMYMYTSIYVSKVSKFFTDCYLSHLFVILIQETQPWKMFTSKDFVNITWTTHIPLDSPWSIKIPSLHKQTKWPRFLTSIRSPERMSWNRPSPHPLPCLCISTLVTSYCRSPSYWRVVAMWVWLPEIHVS